MTVDELDRLLAERFNLQRADLLAALKTLPAIKPGAAVLTEEEARLLDEAGFVEDPGAFAEAAADIVAHTAVLINTAYTGPQVAALLGINESRVRQRRLARTLWAIESDGAWVYPAIQFETNLKTGKPDKQIRGLEQVFQALPAGLHPTAVTGFVRTPQTELQVGGRPLSVLEWLRSGGPVEPVLRLVEIADWAST
jgi:hypothetical protein